MLLRGSCFGGCGIDDSWIQRLDIKVSSIFNNADSVPSFQSERVRSDIEDFKNSITKLIR